MDEQTKGYLERLNKSQELSRSRAEYAMKRLDVVVVTLSSSGILLSVNYLKEITCGTKLWVEISIGLFVLSIISNIISQWYGYYSNSNDDNAYEMLIEHTRTEGKGKTVDEASKKELCDMDDKITRQGNMTEWLSIASTAALILGILMLTAAFIF